MPRDDEQSEVIVGSEREMVREEFKDEKPECRMSGCGEFGTPNFVCSKCGQRNVFFCASCQPLLMSNLMELGKATVICPSCFIMNRDRMMPGSPYR